MERLASIVSDTESDLESVYQLTDRGAVTDIVLLCSSEAVVLREGFSDDNDGESVDEGLSREADTVLASVSEKLDDWLTE